MTKYYALLTDLGAAKLANAAALGTKLQITHMSVGDGGGTLPTPNASQTALVAEKRRAALNALSVDAANSSQIIAEQVIPEGDGGFWIREIGLFDADGVMIAVANCPETYKPQLQEGSGRTQAVRMILIVNSTEAVTLKIDPSVVLATRKYVDDRVIEVKAWADSLMAQHLAAADPHPQYAQKASPVLTGKPTAPTPAKTDNSTQVATTAYVRTALASLVDSSPESLDTLKELAEALGNDPSFAATVMNMLAGKLTKDQNGADIPDPAFFRENIGIKSAALRAVTTTDNPDPDEVIDIKAGDARYLWKQANGSDIPDKKTFRENLELGSSSISNTGSDSGNVPTIAIADARYLTQSTTNVSGYSIFRTPLENGKVLIRQSGFINLKSGLQNIINLPVSLSEIITAAHISIVDADPGPDRPIGISPQSLSVVYVRNWGSNNVMARWTVEGI